MDFDDEQDLGGAHVVVVGNEKGGAGKSTIAIHVCVALLRAGRKIACIDLDSRQRTLTRFLENRASYARSAHWPVELPAFRAVGVGRATDPRAAEAQEFAEFGEAVSAVEHTHEFVLIDTPASDSHLMRLAHSLADTLVSPLNDSFVDVDVFSRVHHDRAERGALGNYGELVLAARRKRRIVDGGLIDWVIARNRIGALATHNARQVAVSLARLADELKFRLVDGLHDRVLYRELFPLGLTALDPVETAGATSAQAAALAAARGEIAALMRALALPAQDLARADARRRWRERAGARFAE